MRLLITGVSGYLGQAVVQRLIRRNPFDQVFGIDRRAPQQLGPVRFVKADLRAGDVGDLLALHGIDRVLHLAYSGTGGLGTAKDELAVLQEILDAADQTDAQRVVVASRDWVYARSATPVTEEALLRKPVGRAAAKVQACAYMAQFAAAHPRLEIVRLRTSPVLGVFRAARLDRVLSLPWLPGLRGGSGMLQLLHAADAAEIFVQAASREGLRGVYNAGGAEPLPLAVVAGILQKPLVELPLWALRGFDHAARLTRALRPEAIAELVGGVPMDTTRWLTEGHYRPRFSTRQVLAMWRAGCRADNGRRAHPLGV